MNIAAQWRYSGLASANFDSHSSGSFDAFDTFLRRPACYILLLVRMCCDNSEFVQVVTILKDV